MPLFVARRPLLLALLLFSSGHAALFDNMDNFLSMFESVRGMEFVEALQNGDEINPQRFRALDKLFGIGCVRGLIRPNMNQGLPETSAKGYEAKSACLTDMEGFATCPANEKISFTDKLDATGNEFRYQSRGPEQQRGVFWLNYKGPFSSIMSFAQSKDGGSLSRGYWWPYEDGVAYRMRAAGDRIWAFSVAENTANLPEGYNETIFDIWQRLDKMYDYVITEGTALNPRRIRIFPSLNLPRDPCYRIHFGPCMDWYVAFEMELVTDPSKKGTRTDSVVWTRRTSGMMATINTYPMVQIIDGNGQPIEPAYSEWLADQSNQSDVGSGDQPNVNWFRAIREDAPLTSESLSC